VQSLRRAGFVDDVTISSDDPNLRWVETGCMITSNREPLGNLRNWNQCLNLLLERANSNDDWVCVCEDDITWVERCRGDLERDLRDLRSSSRLRTVGALSLYFPIAMSREVEVSGRPLERGWHAASRGIKTWGAQCFLFTRQMALDLVKSEIYNEYLSNPKWNKNVDGIVADSIARSDLRILYRVPCLVDHALGEGNSSLGYPDERPKLKTRYFTGKAS
jgi:hypothetical protein